MRRLICLALACGTALLAGSRAPGAEPVRLIFDTDICGDCDDVLAMGMIHALQSRGMCDLLAVTVSADHPQAAPLVDALNQFYGRPTVPIGAVKPPGVQADTQFLHIVDEKDGDAFRYPHTLLRQADAPEAVEVLRRTLAAQPDGSVVIAQVGFSTNLARLVTSPPDAISPLSGRDLVARKVRLLSIMAGSFQPIDGNDHFTEYNVNQDIASCQTLVENWPTEVVWSPFEIGIALEYPHESIERDYGYVKHHPVSAAYIARNPPPHNRPTWDLTSVLYAVYPDRGYFDLSEPGTVVVEKDGFTRFTPAAGGKHRYLILRPEERARVLEALVQLSSQPPCGHPEPGR
jgi:inosine-uridine nucleoside N-ribohydrolase